jgi:cytochrome c biogenesis protein CcdA/thiol-disulfide isomerase/thioredoxin
MLLLFISFIAGILTVLAPCVLPVLPVIVGGSVGAKAKEKLRPYIITGVLALSIIVFTLLLKVSTLFINLSPNTLNYISGGILIALGAVSILPEYWEQLMVKFNWQAASQRFLGKGERNKDQYIGPILVGLALGPVFASCSPTYAFILASVLPHSFLSGLIYLAAYSIGLAVTLLLISLLGNKFIRRFSWAVDTHSWFRRVIGVLFVLIGVIIITGHEVSVETWVANRLPFDETKIERILLAKQNKESLIHKLVNKVSRDDVLNVQPTPAPQFVGLTNWINSKPLTLSQLKGKVVLVDFWTFSCINCIRSLPYLEKWDQAYGSKGLVIIGINTPEFAFEHNPANVQAAVLKDGIKYPVALDNNDDTWNAYDNDSWPADYLVDKQGNIRYVSLGEGNYSTTEEAIQDLLGINKPLTTPKSNVPVAQDQTPETYFGTNREDAYQGTTPISNGTSSFSATPTADLTSNSFTLGGKWTIAGQSITSDSDSSTLTENISAKDVYMVASVNSSSSNGTVNVELPASEANQYGSDAPNGQVMVNGDRLYHIVSLKKFGTTDVTLQVPAGVSLYTFTFGS